ARTGAGGGGKTRGGWAGPPAVVVAREPDAHAEERGPGGSVAPREAHDAVRADSGDGRHSLRIVLLDVVSERSEAEGGPLDVVVVHQPFADEHMHHAQSERAVGARSRLEM